jgi:hypothetical protein
LRRRTEKVVQDEQRDDVEAAVSGEGPTGQLEHLFARQSAASDDKQDVEHGRPNNGTKANLAPDHKLPDERRRQLWCRAAGSHQGRPRDVVGNTRAIDDHLQRRHKILVAHDGQTPEHVPWVARARHSSSSSSSMEGAAGARVLCRRLGEQPRTAAPDVERDKNKSALTGGR